MASCLGFCSVEVLGIITALVAIAYAYLRWHFQFWERRNVPYFKTNLLFQNKEKLPGSRPLSEHIRHYYEKAKSKGWRYLGIFILLRPTFLVIDLELLKRIMTKDFQFFVDRGIYTNEKDDPIGCHLFAIGGTKWRNLRTKLTPTFTSGKLKGMFQTLVDCGVILEQYLKDNAEGKESIDIKDVLGAISTSTILWTNEQNRYVKVFFNMHVINKGPLKKAKCEELKMIQAQTFANKTWTQIRCFSTDVIGSCAFGLDCNSFKEPDSPFRVYGKKVFNPKISRVRFILRATLARFPKLARLLGMRQMSKDISDFYTKVVVDTVNYREKNNYQRNDFMQLLINMRQKNEGSENGKGDNGDKLTMNEIVAQSFVFFIAGFETSSTTMTFALFELATHPEIQNKVREEINTILAKYDNKITYDSLSDMKYLGQVIDEALRKYPPLSLITRLCVADYKIPGDDVVIEKGTRMLIPISGIHYDKEYYENPEVFDPDRFSEENKQSRHQYAHIPFGEGPRLCIGQRFGIMQVKVGLTSVLRNFKITLNEKTETPLKMSTQSFTTSTEGPIWLNIEKL